MGMVGPNGPNSEYLNGLQTEEATKYSNNNSETQSYQILIYQFTVEKMMILIINMIYDQSSFF